VDAANSAAGSHGLSPSVVARSQRTRLIHATAEVMLAKGYPDSTVDDISKVARVARTVFYEHFSDKQQGFLATQEQHVDDVLGRTELRGSGQLRAGVFLGHAVAATDMGVPARTPAANRRAPRCVPSAPGR
jgi:AcrR family transcriptional regulator